MQSVDRDLQGNFVLKFSNTTVIRSDLGLFHLWPSNLMQIYRVAVGMVNINSGFLNSKFCQNFEGFCISTPILGILTQLVVHLSET